MTEAEQAIQCINWDLIFSSLLQEARQQLYRDLTDKNIAFDIDHECLKLNNNSPNICFHPDPTRTVKGSVTPETWDQYSNYNKLRAEAEIQASQRLREAIFATIQKTANDLEAQRQATEFSYRKRIHETEQTKNELQWQQKNVSQYRLWGECEYIRGQWVH